jgi:hypothetical protein
MVYERDRFLSGLEKCKPQVVAQGWQKDYVQNAKTKSHSPIHLQI